jgi:hypothetical protein
MSNVKLYGVPKEAIVRAICIIKNQMKTPYSPAEKRAGKEVSFCAAAALAISGLDLRGLEEKKRTFISEILSSRSSEPIRKVFKDLGWSVATCNKTVIANNSFHPDHRTESVVSFFESALV